MRDLEMERPKTRTSKAGEREGQYEIAKESTKLAFIVDEYDPKEQPAFPFP